MKGVHLIYAIIPILILIAWQQVRAASVREQLVEVRHELNRKKQWLAQARNQEATTVQRIRQNETEMQHQAQKIQGAEKQIKRLKTDIAGKQRMVAETSRAKAEREKLQADRTVELYKQIVAKDKMNILEIPSAISALATTCFISAIEQDSHFITEHTNRITALEQQKTGLQAGKKQQETVKATGQREHARIGKETQQHKTVLVSVQKEQERIVAEIKEYEAKQQRLKTLLASLSKPKKGQARRPTAANGRDAILPNRPVPAMPTDFEKFRLPVSGGKIVRGYGVYRHPEWGTSTFSSGLTIETVAGTPIRSIAAGTVVYSGNLKGYGNIVIVDHGQQVFSVYAHCSMMKRMGTQIAKGEAVATVSIADGESPSLYFELRSKGKAVNPARWIIG